MVLYFPLTSAPSIAFVARTMKLCLVTFETKGKLLEALKLHSMTFIWFSLAMNWMLNGPVISNALAIFLVTPFIFLMVSWYRFWGGRAIVASPECTPAFSI